ncbi:MAG: CHASE2 domain-containing protein [Calothrix sp. MO_192.B10]|nr:CHASE2 domain-containing protein [Calothrix sp. MO_192.B10]
MEKLVILKFDGDWQQQGFRVDLTISKRVEESGSHSRFNPLQEITRSLPANPELAALLHQHWQEKYRNLGAPYRLEPGNIQYDGSVNHLVDECKQSAHQVCDRINNWLKSEQFSDIKEKLLRNLSPDETTRFLIRTKDELLQKLPWQEWDLIKGFPKAEVGLAPYDWGESPTIINRNNKMKILAILGHSEGINVEADRKLLENLPNAEVTFLVEPSRRNINDQLWDQPWDIIFFAGHSRTEGETGRIYINPDYSLTISELWYALRKAVDRGLQLAIFNSCDGLGLARELDDDLHIPQMIVMRELVPDQIAQEFLKYFLTAFSSGQPFHLAVQNARERLHGLEDKFPCATWLPVIYQNPTAVPLTWKPLPTNNLLRRLGTVLLTSVMVTGLVMGVRSLGILQGLELQAYDQMISSRPQEFPDNRFVIIRITEEDLQLPEQEQRGIGHLADKALALLLKKLEPHEPRVIGLDLLRDFRVNTKYRNELANRLRRENFIGICFSGDKSDSGHTSVAAPFQVPSAQIGFNDVKPDKPYNILRRQLLQLDPNTSLCSASEAFSLKVAEHFLKKEGIIPDFPQGNLQLGKVVFKPLEARSSGYQNLNASGHQLLLNFRSVNGSPLNVTNNQFTLGQILRNKVNLDIVRDKIVLIGVDSATANDYFLTPYKKEMPGVIVHAQMISQILSAVLDKRPLLSVWSFSIEILWVWGWSWISGGLVILLWRSPIKLGILGCVVLSSLYIICYIFLIPDVCKNLQVSSVWIPFIPPTLSLIITSGCIIMIERRRAIS